MILCHFFFQLGALEKTSEDGLKVNDHQITCNTLGKRVSIIMYTMGHVLVHEYTHMEPIMKPILGVEPNELGYELGMTKDHAYGFGNCRNLDKNLATRNGDSY
jgi:hypothetical protein